MMYVNLIGIKHPDIVFYRFKYKNNGVGYI